METTSTTHISEPCNKALIYSKKLEEVFKFLQQAHPFQRELEKARQKWEESHHANRSNIHSRVSKA